MDAQRLDETIGQLKVSKRQGLSYYDAKQSLLGKGYTREEIAAASYQFAYNAKSHEARRPAIIAVSDQQAASVGNRILQDHERGRRIYAYFLPVVAAGFADELYRLYLSQQRLSNGSVDHKYLWTNHLGMFVGLSIGTALITFCLLKWYFYRKDKQYAALNKKCEAPNKDSLS